ncbi:DNA-binding transcriptional regulator, MerR family [Burkholderia sp. D7]|nr:DNA-binding transcriptional regulator, MerR family [Burkholderia sp. D7]
MKVGDLAKRAGCKVETVRYYESEGLPPEPARSEGNYRLYGESHVEGLMFIRNCRALDMTLGEIRALLGFKDGGGQDCGDVDALLERYGNPAASAGLSRNARFFKCSPLINHLSQWQICQVELYLSRTSCPERKLRQRKARLAII